MKATKDFLKFRQFLRTQDLSVNEQYLMELLFEFHNHRFGYAYPDIKTLMAAFNTTSKNRVLSTIRKLERKGLLKVDREKWINNRYFIVDVDRFIITKDKKDNELNNTHVDSNGCLPLEGQIDVEEVINQNESESDNVKMVLKEFEGISLSKKQKKVINETDKEILENAIESINVDKVNGNYFLGAIKRIKDKAENVVEKINPMKFNNFQAREYDYDYLENRLLNRVHYEEQEHIEEELPLGIAWMF